MPHPHFVSARLGRLVAVALAVVMGGVIVGLGPVPGSGARPADAATVCGGVLAEGQIRVVVVVDPGSGGPSATCLVVAKGTTGAQLLAERAGALGAPRPRYADSGLLCGLDGYPGTGCGERTADGYRYWAYFSGTSGSWVYGSGNPFIRRLADGDVEGWRFVDGTGTGQDPPPRLAPSSGLFPPLPQPPTVTAPPPSPGGGGGGEGGGGGGSSAVSSGGSGPSGLVASGAEGAHVAPPASGADPTVPTTGLDGSTASTVSGVGVDEGGSDADPDATELAADVARSSSSGAAGPLGAVIAGVVIAGLAVATFLRSRAQR